MQNKIVALPARPASGPLRLAKNTIPLQLTPLIGREHELAQVLALLQRPGVRLVTLTGTGGVGKTRLGLAVANALLNTFPDGVCFVSLAPISDPERVMSTIAQALGLWEARDRPMLAQVQDYLHDQHLLLLLDNFEQLVEAAPQLVDLLAFCPQLTILVTSREPLRLHGEYEFTVPPLAVPDLTQLPALADLAQVPTVQLFIERAQAIRANFQLTATNAHAIAEVCVRLDGLPLAIELAAARIKLLPPQALLKRLSHRLELLTGGAHHLPARQQTLRNTLQWSYDLLNAEEQRLFRWLSIFVGGCTLEAATAVCHTGAGQAINMLDGIASLLDKSLLQQTEQEDEEPRLLLLETIREYGLECLGNTGELEAAQRAHALYYLALVQEAERQFGGEQALWLAILEREYDNLRAALHRLSERQEAELSLRLSSALYWFWVIRGYINEGYYWLEAALANSESSPAEVRAKALKNAAGIAYQLSKHEQTEARCQEALALYRQLGDTRGYAMTLYWLGLEACWTKHDYPQARAFAEESLALLTALHDTSGMADALMIISYVALNQGNYAEARLYTEQAQAYFREADDAWGMAYALQYAGRTMLEQGDYAPASTRIEESLLISTRLSYKAGIAYALGLLGHIALRQGDAATARTLIEESLAKHRERDQQRGISESLLLLAKVSQAEENYDAARTLYDECLALLAKLDEPGIQIRCLEGLGTVVLAQGRPAWAVLLWSAAAQLRKVQGIPMSPLDRGDYEQAEATARTQLGEKPFASLWEKGRTMTPEQVLTASAREPAPPPQSEATEQRSTLPPRQSPTYPAGLTVREVEVLRLVSQGLTDAQIAEQLVISLRTVTTHLTSIYNKLGVNSRAAATRFAVEHHLI